MPTIQKSIGRPSASSGGPQRTSSSARQIEGGLGQLRHRERDVLHRRALLDVEDREALQHELARDAQRAGERPPCALQAPDQRRDVVAARQARRQQRQLLRIAAADALDEAAVIGARRWRGCIRVRGVGQRDVRQGTHGGGGGLC
jgi:hypothetical protein